MRRTLAAALALVSVIPLTSAAWAQPGGVELATLPGGTRGSALAISGTS